MQSYLPDRRRRIPCAGDHPLRAVVHVAVPLVVVGDQVHVDDVLRDRIETAEPHLERRKHSAESESGSELVSNRISFLTWARVLRVMDLCSFPFSFLEAGH